jgi:hypothetical protein
MGDRLCQSHVRHPDERPTETVVETVDENEDDHRGEKYDGPSETDPTYRKSYSGSSYAQPDNLVDRTFLMPLRKMELESEPRSSSVNEYKDGMLDDPSR